MADPSPSVGKALGTDLKVDHLVESIGWHLVQGEQLSRSYARFAEEAGEPEKAAFFRTIEAACASLLDTAGMPPTDSIMFGRPPFR